MSDIPTSLIDRLARQYTGGVVYLPKNADDLNGIADQAERRSTDPRVNAAQEEYFESPDRLHGDSISEHSIIAEKPIHRMMVYLSASGASVEDIAAQTGYSTPAIYQVLRQPWARQRLVQILNETGRDRVKHFLTNEVVPSLDVLREVRDNKQARESARIAAANSILDRALGKPTVHVESDNTNRTVPADVARLDAEIASVRKQLADKGIEQPAPSQN